MSKPKPKSMLAIKHLIYSIPSIHSHPPLWILKARQNDDMILVLTHESVRNAILPFGKLCHTKQNHCANTFPSTASLLLYILLHKVPLQEGQLFLRSSLLFPNIFVLLQGNYLDNNSPVSFWFSVNFCYQHSSFLQSASLNALKHLRKQWSEYGN